MSAIWHNMLKKASIMIPLLCIHGTFMSKVSTWVKAFLSLGSILMETRKGRNGRKYIAVCVHPLKCPYEVKSTEAIRRQLMSMNFHIKLEAPKSRKILERNKMKASLQCCCHKKTLQYYGICVRKSTPKGYITVLLVR